MNVKPCTFCLLIKSIQVLLFLHVSTNICWKNPSLYIWYHVLLYKIKSPAMVLPSYSNVLQVSQRKSPTFVSSSDEWCTSTHSPSSSESSLQDSQSITYYTNMCIMILSLLQIYKLITYIWYNLIILTIRYDISTVNPTLNQALWHVPISRIIILRFVYSTMVPQYTTSEFWHNYIPLWVTKAGKVFVYMNSGASELQYMYEMHIKLRVRWGHLHKPSLRFAYSWLIYFEYHCRWTVYKSYHPIIIATKESYSVEKIIFTSIQNT